MTATRGRGRPPKLPQTVKEPEPTPVIPTPPSPASAEAVLPSSSPSPDPEPLDTTPAIDVDSRRRQWDSMSNIDKGKLGMSLEEFLSTEDVTGMGINSRFTSPEERGFNKMSVKLKDV